MAGKKRHRKQAGLFCSGHLSCSYGKIAEHWDVADTFMLFKQVGIIDRLMAQKAAPANITSAIAN
jgi:hypothetical protein